MHSKIVKQIKYEHFIKFHKTEKHINVKIKKIDLLFTCAFSLQIHHDIPHNEENFDLFLVQENQSSDFL